MPNQRYDIVGTSAAQLARCVEDGVLTGALRPGQALPSVRGLARDLDLSPTTVAKAYRELRRRGVVVTEDRARTVVAHRPELRLRLAPTVPEGTVDLATGNPDARLLPSLAPASRTLPTAPARYTDDVLLPALVELARSAFTADGVDADHLLVVGGGLDGIERVLEAHLRLGDRIGVEDPGYPGSLDQVRALGLEPISIELDDQGPVPASLAAALTHGVEAVLLVPRAQNPTGAAWSAERTTALRELLAHHPDVLVIEDDHAAPIAGVPARTLTTARARWAVIRSVAKWLGPQLRVGVLAGDEATTTRVLARQRLGTGWVSQVLQHLVAVTWATAAEDGTLQAAATAYTERRSALLAALAEHGIPASGRTGLNVWVPVDEEVPVVQGLAELGWAVAAGEAFRLTAPPAIRITVSGLSPTSAPRVARDVAQVLEQRLTGRQG
ncbi:MAG: aminotransferase class I/II-fold pyridoxal phosphate-dependent enzyme [Nitriliruptor sp.]|nr:MAG: aminotransferase class I/II-fold pyridoxal phosphate-dependent enzyme [Nitriliruptor sp.]